MSIKNYNMFLVQEVQVLLVNALEIGYTNYNKYCRKIVGRGPKSVSHQVVATLLSQLDFCTLVNRNLFANHYLKVSMF